MSPVTDNSKDHSPDRGRRVVNRSEQVVKENWLQNPKPTGGVVVVKAIKIIEKDIPCITLFPKDSPKDPTTPERQD